MIKDQHNDEEGCTSFRCLETLFCCSSDSLGRWRYRVHIIDFLNSNRKCGMSQSSQVGQSAVWHSLLPTYRSIESRYLNTKCMIIAINCNGCTGHNCDGRNHCIPWCFHRALHEARIKREGRKGSALSYYSLLLYPIFFSYLPGFPNDLIR